jgi:flavodoxin
MKSLVVYYSRTGNAKFVAETAAKELGADLEEIVDLKKRAGPLGWMSAGRAGQTGKGTEIAAATKVPADYDFIMVGTPI